jgi:polyhydroxyalkanoate synthesis repressor PhaR
MHVIKRYPNRKLYDTEAKQYVSLDRIAELIRQGDEIHVVDHTTHEDLTTITLTQVIFEQEKKQDSELPRTILTALIRASGDTLNTMRRTLTSPLDWLRQVDEEIDRRLQVLVRRGELAEEDFNRLRDQLLTRSHRAAAPADPQELAVERALTERGTPTRGDIARLDSQLDALLATLESIEPDSAVLALDPESQGHSEAKTLSG